MQRKRTNQILSNINKNHQLKAGLILLSIVVLIAIFAPLIANYDPYYLGQELLLPPGKEHYLGTDGLGRDVFSMIVYGTRTSLLVGIIAALISGILGVIIGGIAGYYGGKADWLFAEINNIFMMIPTFFLILIIVALFGSSLLNVMIVIGITSWPGSARLMRAQALSLRERTYIKSAQAIGESNLHIIFRYIIPNGIFPVIANLTMDIGRAILTEAGLSFLGLGDPNIVSWGQMINQGRMYLTSGWWVSTFPGVAILLIVVIFYILGDGINFILNPKTRSMN